MSKFRRIDNKIDYQFLTDAVSTTNRYIFRTQMFVTTKCIQLFDKIILDNLS